MTNKEIEQAEKGLSEIEEMSLNEQYKPMIEWIEKYHVSVSLDRPTAVYSPKNPLWMREALGNAHRFLQTKMMFNACVSASESGELAKRSCKWAAIAASIALLATIAAWITVVLTLRGI